MKKSSGRVNGDATGCRETESSCCARQQFLIEEERSRISREIHDELGQYLTVLKYQLFSLEKKLSDEGHPLKEVALSAIATVNLLITSVQSIAHTLRPAVLEELGLMEAIEWQVRQFEAATEIRCGLCMGEVPDRLSPEMTTGIFRILQEALTNVARHAWASRVEVSLKKDGNFIVLEAGDDGKGIPLDVVLDPRSLGLAGIRDRVRLLNGEVTITGIEGKGTKVIAHIPLAEDRL